MRFHFIGRRYTSYRRLQLLGLSSNMKLAPISVACHAYRTPVYLLAGSFLDDVQ
jgi:hypothetical protein